MNRLRVTAIAAGLAVVSGSTGVVLAGGSTDPSGQQSPASNAQLTPRSVPSQVQPAIGRRFRVLRRNRRVSDALPLSASKLVNDPDTPNTSGSNGSLARDSGAGPPGTRVFVAPGNDAVCVVVDAPGPEGGDVAMGGCADLQVAEAGRFVHGSYGGPFGGPDEVLAYGLVPDGVDSVVLENGAGERRRVAVSGNVWAARVRDKAPVTVSFQDVQVEVP
jgi:hypothetical protein